MRRETPEEKVRREQRELIARLNAARDAKYTTAHITLLILYLRPAIHIPAKVLYIHRF